MKQAVSPLAGLLVCLGASFFYQGVSLAAEDRPALTLVGVGLGLFVAAVWLQSGARTYLSKGQPRWVEVEVTTQNRLVFASLIGLVGALTLWLVCFLTGLQQGQSLFLGFLGALVGGLTGWALTPKLLASEVRYPSGLFRG